MEIVHKYFPDLSEKQVSQFEALQSLYEDWNSKINVVSRKDIHELYMRHVLHSLAIARVVKFKPGESVLDIGTGGGFPGIPLAIYFPETEFVLMDSITKKIKIVNEVINDLGLSNTRGFNDRAESINRKFDYSVSRAVKWAKVMQGWVGKNIKKEMLFLKGGDLTEELTELQNPYELIKISDHFDEAFFETKCVLRLKMT